MKGTIPAIASAVIPVFTACFISTHPKSFEHGVFGTLFLTVAAISLVRFQFWAGKQATR